MVSQQVNAKQTNRGMLLTGVVSRAQTWLHDDARADVVAGLTTGSLFVPQSVAYAQLAQLPIQHGLYSAMAGSLAYAMVGRSRQLSVGPVALDSLMVGAIVTPMAAGDPLRAVVLASCMALMVGITQVVAGFVRGGYLANFVSTPVLSGFTAAAALLIAQSQVPVVLGWPSGLTVDAILHGAAIQAPHVATALVAAISLASLVALQQWAPKWPRALLVLVAAGAAVALLPGLEQVRTIGSIPAGLPVPNVPLIAWSDFVALWPTTTALALLAFVEAWSGAVRFAKASGEKLDADRELKGLGVANMAAGLLGGFPVTGGLSRSAVLFSAGARSRAAGVISALVVLGVLLGASDLLAKIPRPALAALILASVIPLVDVKLPIRLWKIRHDDSVMWLVSFASTLFLGFVEGIAIGVVASLVWFVVRTSRPHMAVLGRIPGTVHFRNVLHFPDAIVTPELLIARVDAQLYFGNVSYVSATIEEWMLERPGLKAVVLDATAVNALDTTAEAWLQEFHTACKSRGIHLALSGVKHPVADVLRRAGFEVDGQSSSIHRGIDDAIRWMCGMKLTSCECGADTLGEAAIAQRKGSLPLLDPVLADTRSGR